MCIRDSLFNGATSFDQDLGGWEVSSATTMIQAFANAGSFNQDLSDWNVSAVSSMTNIFAGTDSLSNANKGLIHESFSPNENWPYDWGIFANDAPMDLNSTDLLVSENQPVGTRVGEFNATDPDGDILTYALVNGVGATDNAWFTLETNGTLKTATTFDYETNASTSSMRVRGSDE